MISGDTELSSSNGLLVFRDEHQEDRPETARASQFADGTRQRERRNMAVVYDDHDIGAILARALEKLGYPVKTMPYKRGTLNALREGGFGLAVLDVKIAAANGLGTLEAIREADPGLPLILVGGLGDAIRHTMQLGIEGWLEKPFRLEEVRTAAKRVLGQNCGGG